MCSYILKQGWIEKNENEDEENEENEENEEDEPSEERKYSFNDQIDEEDDELIPVQEKFEETYNFRHLEP